MSGRYVLITEAQRKQLDRIIRDLEEYGGLLGNTNAFTVQAIRDRWDTSTIQESRVHPAPLEKGR